ncbi:hypothetical protein [Streptomyces sp. NPDC003023]|uniref:hypothetical protein n=1 Tax=Streptomyces sp. NPDC003023 TaxID=3364675 RepID=UPI0036A56692
MASTTYSLVNGCMIVATEGRGAPSSAVASLRRDRGSGTSSAHPTTREFSLRAGRDWCEALAGVTTESVSGDLTVYRVDDPTGKVIGFIRTRRGSIRALRRPHWTVEPVNGLVAQGSAGRLLWWVMWCTAFMPWYFVVLLAARAGLGVDQVACPRRLVLRDGSVRPPLVYRGVLNDYRATAGAWDPRLVAAVVGIHQTYTAVAVNRSVGWYAEG